MSPTTRLSYEFFPPRSEAQSRRFWRTLGALEPLAPHYVSLTWGALGSDSGASLETLALLARDTTLDVAAHLSCVGQTRTELRATLDTLEGFGVGRIVALRGDVVDGRTVAPTACTHASDLVELIAAERPHLDVSVAAYPETHPEAASAEDDVRHLGHKLDAGADRAITQFFFEPDTYLRWRDRTRAAGITKPLVPGILPVHDIAKVQLVRREVRRGGAPGAGRAVRGRARRGEPRADGRRAVRGALPGARARGGGRVPPVHAEPVGAVARGGRGAARVGGAARRRVSAEGRRAARSRGASGRR